MNFFNLDIRKLILITILAAVPLLTLNIKNESGQIPWFIRPFSFTGGLIQYGYSSFSSGVRGTTSTYFDLIDIKKQNRVLLQQNTEYRAQLNELTELKLENERLNKLLNFKQKTNMELLTAKVVGKDLIPEHNTITINRGTLQGVKERMAAITVGGAVGYVYSAEPFTSQIILLTDRYAAIDAIVQRSRARGIIEGYTSELTQLNYLKRGDDVREGDLIVTSGLDNIFPKGFPIGTVVEVEKNDYDVSQKVDVKPIVNPSNLEELFIVLGANYENLLDKDQIKEPALDGAEPAEKKTIEQKPKDNKPKEPET